MKLFNRNIFALLASASLLASCSDDVLNRENNSQDAGEGIVIYVPYVSEDAAPATGTRAEGNVNGFDPGEAAIKTLSLIAYRTGDEKPVMVNLLDNTQARPANPGPDMDSYKAYRLDLENGDYQMYVIANATVPADIKQSELLATTVQVPANIAESGLPMSCTNDNLYTKAAGESVDKYTPVGSGRTISVSKDNPINIKADMRFAVAKVRVTLLNDLRGEDLLTNATVSNHAKASALLENGTAPTEKGTAFDPTGKYYQLPTIPATGMLNADIENMTPMTATPDGKTPYAWQTVFYIPERLSQNVDNDDCSAITVKVGNDAGKKHYIGHQDPSKGKIVQRSHFYDYVGRPDGKFYLDVQPWTIETMAGALHGPYTLHVNKTELEIEGGEPVEIWYESNTSIKPVSNQYQGEDIYTFDYPAPNTLRVSLNSEIDRTKFEAIKATNDWTYFTIQAGTLVKKIDVNDLKFNEFITPSTDILTIDVSEKKTSGYYSRTEDIIIRSNIEELTVKKIGWPAEANEGTPKSLMLWNSNEEELETGDIIKVPSNGQYNLKIRYNDLNSTRKLWKEDHDMEVVLEGKDKDGQTIECVVKVYVRAAYDVYRIHFYAPDWSHPHIYAYQCLQMPGDLDESRTGAKRNQIVGYHSDAAALEYDFTGGAAFKGWNVGNYNNPYDNGRQDNGFWIFEGNNAGGWEPGITNWERHYYDMDFCATHRAEVATKNLCSKCTGNNHDRSWPGIQMLPDEERGAGWWYFNLSGVAAPGKTLIMFTECSANDHTYYDWMEGKRYPKKEQPGLALFDYPNKEAFFVYIATQTNLTFTANDPSTGPETYFTYRLYWPYNASTWKGLNAWQGATVWGNTLYNSWGSVQDVTNGKFGKFNDSYAYLEFRSADTPLSGNMKYQKIDGSGNYDSAQPTVNFSSFQLVNGIYSYTINSVGSGQGGVPSGGGGGGGDDPVTDKYTVYYKAPASWGTATVHCFYKKNGNDYPGCNWPGPAMTKQGDVWMYQIPKDADQVIFNNGNSGKGNQTNDLAVENNKTYEGNLWQ